MGSLTQSESGNYFSDKESGKRVHKGTERVPLQLLHRKRLPKRSKRNMARIKERDIVPINNVESQKDIIAVGWNACIDKITGENTDD